VRSLNSYVNKKAGIGVEDENGGVQCTPLGVLAASGTVRDSDILKLGKLHDEVLARLLDLNQKRHEAEILGGKHASTKAKSNKRRKSKATQFTQTNVQQLNLLGE